MKLADCPFCNCPPQDVVLHNELCYARFDKFPVSKGHILIIPYRHFDSYFDSQHEEKLALLALVDETKILVDKKFAADGYNLGINIGQYAGQTIMHLHMHLIPRYKGDVEDPSGGVRGVIPNNRHPWLTKSGTKSL